MKQVLFLLTGSFRPDPKSKLDFKELAVTGPHTGTVNYGDCMRLLRSGGQLGVATSRRISRTSLRRTLPAKWPPMMI